ncbi:GspH/FimT family pseudopilin [Thioalkalivibrio sp. AKL17]|uniref:GspH/FimT family pseudopilin n=1 Tax=Thioalkalivibrio sp. AKL17 TaxID=1158160 RepID=UPI00056DA5DD|nr:GspH/FimT family pseudopilin [Thioalkalivibrio sp. AKL17]
MRTEKGVTVIELMTAVALLFVLLLVAVPNLSNVLERQRLLGTTHSLVSTMHLARSEAIKRNQRVVVCPSSDGVICREDGDWSHGWIWFVDNESTGERSAGDVLIGSASPDHAETIDINGNQPVSDYVAYTSRGVTRRSSGALQMGSFTLCSRLGGRRVVISSIGRPRTASAPACGGD